MSIWQNNTTSVPKSDSRITRVPFDHQAIGARKSHISGVHKKNDEVIVHVGGK